MTPFAVECLAVGFFCEHDPYCTSSLNLNMPLLLTLTQKQIQYSLKVSLLYRRDLLSFSLKRRSHCTFHSIDFHSNSCECVRHRPETQTRAKIFHCSLVNSGLRINVTAWPPIWIKRTYTGIITCFVLKFLKRRCTWRRITSVAACKTVLHTQSSVTPAWGVFISLLVSKVFLHSPEIELFIFKNKQALGPVLRTSLDLIVDDFTWSWIIWFFEAHPGVVVIATGP